MLIVPRGADVIVEAVDGSGSPHPGACLGTGGAVIKVIVNQSGALSFVHLGFGHRQQAARPSVNDVIGKDIVRHVPLHLELAAAGR